MMIYK